MQDITSRMMLTASIAVINYCIVFSKPDINVPVSIC